MENKDLENKRITARTDAGTSNKAATDAMQNTDEHKRGRTQDDGVPKGER